MLGEAFDTPTICVTGMEAGDEVRFLVAYEKRQHDGVNTADALMKRLDKGRSCGNN